MYGNGVGVSDVKIYKACKCVEKICRDAYVGWYFMWDMGVPSRFQNTFHYDMKKCVMWFRRDDRVTLDLSVRDWTGVIPRIGSHRTEVEHVRGMGDGNVSNCVHIQRV